MRKMRDLRILIAGLATVAVFVLWTVLISYVDVRPIGPEGSQVGFAALNGAVHRLTGVNMTLYVITDWLGLVPMGFIVGFAILGLVQLIKRKNLLKVDPDILILGVFYIVVMAAYLFFESHTVNYRPVLINGFLEASYPSSTTLLVMCVILTAIIQLESRIRTKIFRKTVICILTVFAVLMVAGRLVSGVHWITDIIGGIILSSGLVMMYSGITGLVNRKMTIQ